jgi:hypothetical protein
VRQAVQGGEISHVSRTIRSAHVAAKRIGNESENESGMTGAAAAAHASMVSQPGATTDLILAAARAVVAA